MPKLPVLSGHKLIQIPGKIGFVPARQAGSHVVLVKKDQTGKHAVVVPNHKEIDKGTLAEIIRQECLKRHEFLKLVK